jgi:hypothetical protein
MLPLLNRTGARKGAHRVLPKMVALPQNRYGVIVVCRVISDASVRSGCFLQFNAFSDCHYAQRSL